MSDSPDQTTFSSKSWVLIGLVFVVGLSILFWVARNSTANRSGPTEPTIISADDPVIARLYGEPITGSQLELARAFFSQENADGTLISRESALQRLIQQRLLVRLAKEQKTGEQPYTQNRVRFARDMILAEDALDGYLETAVSDDDIQKFYDEETRNWSERIQIKARQIVLPDAATAKEITRRLDGGEAFASLALAYSLDRPSRESGGDLGYLNRDMLDPVLSDKIFAAKDGERIEQLETPQGWHVVEIIGRRKAPIPSFEDRQDAIKSLLQAQKLQIRLNELEAAGNLEISAPIED